jgi:hypothetical protein
LVRIVVGAGLVSYSFLGRSDNFWVVFLVGLLFLDGSYREWRLWKLEELLQTPQQPSAPLT